MQSRPHVGSIIDTPDRMLEVIRQVGSPAVGVNFDISHFNVMGIGIEESVAKMAPPRTSYARKGRAGYCARL